MTLLAALTAAAWAQSSSTFDLHPTPVLVPGQDGTAWTANGIGSPAVVWDPNRQRFIMFFETRLGSAATCPVGTWGIGYATSPDGFAWTVHPNPIVEPRANSFFSCVAAHPTAVYDIQNRAATVWFKAEQGTDACNPSVPTWGCDQYTGVGRARIKFRVNGNLQQVLVENAPDLVIGQNFGYPKFVEKSGTGYLMLTRYPEAYMASGPKSGSGQYGWVFDATTPVLSPGVVSWAMDEHFNPALVCEDSALFPFSSYVGGRTRAGGTIADAGWGQAISSDAFSWALGTTPEVTWTGELAWRHWDVLRTTTNDVVVFYSQKNASLQNEIYVAATDLAFNPADIYDKQCP